MTSAEALEQDEQRTLKTSAEQQEKSTQNVRRVLEQEENEQSRCQKSSRAGQEQSTQDVSRHV